MILDTTLRVSMLRESTPWGVPELPWGVPESRPAPVEPSSPRLPEEELTPEPGLVEVEPSPMRRPAPRRPLRPLNMGLCSWR
jgi:hypothetical protein